MKNKYMSRNIVKISLNRLSSLTNLLIPPIYACIWKVVFCALEIHINCMLNAQVFIMNIWNTYQH